LVWSFAYLAVRNLFALVVLFGRPRRLKELEILVLRHELAVLRRVGFTNSIALQIGRIRAPDRICEPYARGRRRRDGQPHRRSNPHRLLPSHRPHRPTRTSLNTGHTRNRAGRLDGARVEHDHRAPLRPPFRPAAHRRGGAAGDGFGRRVSRRARSCRSQALSRSNRERPLRRAQTGAQPSTVAAIASRAGEEGEGNGDVRRSLQLD
jgi:hypothetical protein